MIGIIVVTHSNLGESMLQAVKFILGKDPESSIAVSIDLNENAEKIHNKISQAIKQFNKKDGIIIFTDMFGGTPSNLSYSFLEEGRIEVISGVNLPMILKAIELQKESDMLKILMTLEEYGKKSISIASSILKGNKRGAVA